MTSIWVNLKQTKIILFSYFLYMNLKIRYIAPSVHKEREIFFFPLFFFYLPVHELSKWIQMYSLTMPQDDTVNDTNYTN